MSKCLALLTIPYMLRESAVSFFDDGESRQPRLRCQGDDLLTWVNSSNISVVVEDTVVCVVNDFINAFAVLIATHYVFNLAYASKLEGTYCTIQKLLLELVDNTRVPNKVLNLICKLKKN